MVGHSKWLLFRQVAPSRSITLLIWFIHLANKRKKRKISPEHVTRDGISVEFHPIPIFWLQPIFNISVFNRYPIFEKGDISEN